MSRQLEVWLSGSHIGTLAQVDGRLAFHYAADWLTHSAAMPLSQSLPLRAEPFDDRATRPFFSDLLPEGVDILPHLGLRPPLAREGGGFLRCYA